MDTTEEMVESCDGFFKIMLDDFSDKLTIPPKFVESVIGEQDWKVVKLTSSFGKVWTVELEEDADGYRCFGNGWKDFVQGHDLRFGYFLLFDYSGNMGFFVRVFDHTACMIRYGDSINNGNHDDGDDNAAEEGSKSLEKSKDCKPEVIYLDQTEEENVMHQQSQQTEDKPQLDFSGKPKFRVTMRACDLLSKTSMHIIPTSFLDSNNLTCIRKATLSNSAGTWTMNVHHRLRNKRKRNEFGNGWLTFFKENKLKAGDVCIFKLVSVTKDEAHFFVTREKDLISLNQKNKETSVDITGDKSMDDIIDVENYEQQKDVQSKKRIEKQQRCSRYPKRQKVAQAKSSSTGHIESESFRKPQFVVTIKRHNFLSGSCSHLEIPKHFKGWKFFSGKSKVKLVNSEGKSWLINIYRCPKRIKFGSGWLFCARDNGLKSGDVCCFTLISKNDVVMRLDVLNRRLTSKQVMGSS